jgi:glycosyltransferase involved in cell wall biosynthesis
VVANAVGGLVSLIEHERTGFLVPGRDPEMFARHTAELLGDSDLRTRMSVAAAEGGRRYTWSFAAARLRRLYTDVTSRSLVNCS